MRWAWASQLDDADEGDGALAIAKECRGSRAQTEGRRFGSNRGEVLDECCDQSAGGGGRESPRISEDSARFRAKIDLVTCRPTANHAAIAKAETSNQSSILGFSLANRRGKCLSETGGVADACNPVCLSGICFSLS
jgi:hypothetical protein